MTNPVSRLVLVVDDDADTRDILCMALEQEGVRCAAAADGAEALERAARLKPDAIVLDLGLPDIEGCEVNRRLKANPQTSAIPVIVLTGHALTSDRQRAIAAGCRTFLAKPCDVSDVLRVLLELWEPPAA